MLYISFASHPNGPITTREADPSVFLNYDDGGNLVGVEIISNGKTAIYKDGWRVFPVRMYLSLSTPTH